MSDFLFHNVSEKEREEIRKEAKEIMESFSKKLAKVDKNLEEHEIDRDVREREEKIGKEEGLNPTIKPQPPSQDINKEKNDFRKIMFENAPRKSKNKDFILSEKGKW